MKSSVTRLTRLSGYKISAERIALDQYLVNVVALRALERAEVETYACGHDASEHHVSTTPGASGVMDASVDFFGRSGTKFCHDASLEKVGRERNTLCHRQFARGGAR